MCCISGLPVISRLAIIKTKNNMKRISLLLAASACLFFLSCKGKEEPKSEPIPAASFDVMAVMHTVKDFDAWKAAYMAHDSVRKANGLETFTMGRGVEDPNLVYVTHKMADVTKAKALAASPELKTAMDSAGVTSPPEFDYGHVIRMDTSGMDQKLRLRIKHHVKDFDAWLKVYDAEGKEKRLEYGLADRSMARGIDDPNMVYITFYVTDGEKAKARGASPELKKIMEEAGVDSEPQILMYTVVN